MFNIKNGSAICLGAISIIIAGCSGSNKSNSMEAPVAKTEKKELTIHGHTRLDDYYWLNQRDNPEVIAYLEAENAYTKSLMKHTETLQEKLYNEMVGRIVQKDMSVPYRENGYYYYSRYEEGREYPVYCRKKGELEAAEEVMLDVNKMAEGYSFFDIGSFQVSEDNRLIAYSVDTVSRRIYTIYVKDLETGQVFADRITNTSGNLTWANDNKTLFYSTKDETLRSDKIWKHCLGDGEGSDMLVYQETDATFSTFITKSKSRKYLIIGSGSTLSDEYRILEADNPGGQFRVFQERIKGLEYSIAHVDDRFYIRTNDQAVNFRLMVTPEGKTNRENWKEVIPHREDVLLEDFDVFKDFLAIQERRRG